MTEALFPSLPDKRMCIDWKYINVAKKLRLKGGKWKKREAENRKRKRVLKKRKSFT